MNISDFGLYAEISQEPIYYLHLVDGNHFSRSPDGVVDGQPDIWVKLNNQECKPLQYMTRKRYVQELDLDDERIYSVKLIFTSLSKEN